MAVELPPVKSTSPNSPIALKEKDIRSRAIQESVLATFSAPLALISTFYSAQMVLAHDSPVVALLSASAAIIASAQTVHHLSLANLLSRFGNGAESYGGSRSAERVANVGATAIAVSCETLCSLVLLASCGDPGVAPLTAYIRAEGLSQRNPYVAALSDLGLR